MVVFCPFGAEGGLFLGERTMNQKKKTSIVWVAWLFAAVLSIIIFTGCDKQEIHVTGGVPDKFDGYVTLVLDDPATEEADAFFQLPFEELESGATAFDLIEHFSEKDKIFYEGYEGDFGYYFTSIGYKKEGENVTVAKYDTASRTFVSVYTSIEKYFGGMPMTYGTVTLETSTSGVSGILLEDGAVIYLTQGTY